MSAWAELVNADGSDEWLGKCEAALLEVQRETLRKAAVQGDRLVIGGKSYEVEGYEWQDYAEESSNYSVWVKREDSED